MLVEENEHRRRKNDSPLLEENERLRRKKNWMMLVEENEHACEIFGLCLR